MSRLWDTPEFWVRAEADQLLSDYPDTVAAVLARTLRRDLGSYDGDPQVVRGIVGKLHRRAEAGVRVWAGPTGIGGRADRGDDVCAAAGTRRANPVRLAWHAGVIA
jgi:hypothetical protein